jgi:hypothetical protein
LLLHRRDDFADAAGGGDLVLLERLVGEIEKRLLVLPQRAVRQRLERLFYVGLDRQQRLLLLRRGRRAGLAGRLLRRQLLGRRRGLCAQRVALAGHGVNLFEPHLGFGDLAGVRGELLVRLAPLPEEIAGAGEGQEEEDHPGIGHGAHSTPKRGRIAPRPPV